MLSAEFIIVTIVGIVLIGILSIFIYKIFHRDRSKSQISKLSGALKSKQIQAEILMQSIADGIIVTDTQGVINLYNPAASRITGWAAEEAIGLDVKSVVSLQSEEVDPESSPKSEDPFSQVLSERKAMSNTYQLLARDNTSRMVSFVVSPVLLPDTQEIAGTVAVIRDVSSAKAEEQRRADFISTASHEMRTPVAAIEGYLALALNDRVSNIDSKARDYLQKAHSSTQHLGKLFQDLLTSAKAEDGRLVSHPSVVEIGEYLEQVTDSLKFSAEKKGLLVEFIVGTSDTTPNEGDKKVIKPFYYTSVDPDRLREVITNLFDNAVKYTETGKITVGLTGNKDVVQIYIKDTGNGIPKEDIPHLFQKFYRVDNTSTRTIGGTGLGLFICKKIIELYKGRIWVESEQNQGSTFYINLPRISSNMATELRAKEAGKNQL